MAASADPPRAPTATPARASQRHQRRVPATVPTAAQGASLTLTMPAPPRAHVLMTTRRPRSWAAPGGTLARRLRCRSTLLLGVAMAVALGVVVTNTLLVDASRGDRSSQYTQCVHTKTALNCGSHRAPPTKEPKPEYQLSWAERLLGWTCQENVMYRCMWAVTDKWVAQDVPVQQFRGKWPFKRVLGIQELVSTLASVGNAIPHALYYFRRRDQYAPAKFPLAGEYKTYSLVAMNAWLWSTVFHARDMWWTERLDYHCASALVLYAFYVGVLRATGTTSAKGKRAIGVLLLLLLIAHVAYLNLSPRFDYSFNMTMSVVVAISNSLAWFTHCYRHKHSAVWKCYVAHLGMWLAGLMEVFDFPPWMWLFDAHALWHCSTIPLGFVWYSFLADDVAASLRSGSGKIV